MVHELNQNDTYARLQHSTRFGNLWGQGICRMSAVTCIIVRFTGPSLRSWLSV